MNRYKMVNSRTKEVLEFTRPYLTGREIKWATQMVHDYIDRTISDSITISIYRNDVMIALINGFVSRPYAGAACRCVMVITDLTKHMWEPENIGRVVDWSYLPTGQGIETLTCMEEAWR